MKQEKNYDILYNGFTVEVYNSKQDNRSLIERLKDNGDITEKQYQELKG